MTELEQTRARELADSLGQSLADSVNQILRDNGIASLDLQTGEIELVKVSYPSNRVEDWDTYWHDADIS